MWDEWAANNKNENKHQQRILMLERNKKEENKVTAAHTSCSTCHICAIENAVEIVHAITYGSDECSVCEGGEN